MKQLNGFRRDLLVMTVFALACVVLEAIFYARNRAGQKPRDVYGKVAAYFPDLTPAEQEQRLGKYWPRCGSGGISCSGCISTS
jgi:hypothetical protein